MNSLSWLLYFAEMFDSLKTLLIASSIMSFIVAVFWTIGCSASADKFIPPKIRYLVMIFLLSFVACFIPSRTTILLIAGSEMSEKVITSKDGQEIFDLLKKKIKEELKNGETDNRNNK